MEPEYGNRVSDPVYGSILLSDLELRVIDTPVFQRLRNIKHLGLAHMVYPSAGFSRFSHSIGVCYLTGRMLDVLRAKGCLRSRRRIGQLIQKYRLAGLLHDIGHYPFSHCIEEAARDFFTGKLYNGQGRREAQPGQSPEQQNQALPHTEVGRSALENDPQLKKLLTDHGFPPAEVADIFTREKVNPLDDLISSDLDADRIDSLLRSSLHTGLPYGTIDSDYLVSQIDLKNDQICFSGKAVKAVEHFLISRYFDYAKVAWHRTVAAFELMLKDVVSALIESEAVKCSEPDIRKKIENEEWVEFDDNSIMSDIKGILKDPDKHAEPVRLKASAIVNRRPPKLVAEVESFAPRGGQTARNFDGYLRQLRDKKDELQRTHGIPETQWFEWTSLGRLSFTELPSQLPTSDALVRDPDELRASERLCTRILDCEGKPGSIIDNATSMMPELSKYALYVIRLYVLFPDQKQESDSRMEITNAFRQTMPDLPWTHIKMT